LAEIVSCRFNGERRERGERTVPALGVLDVLNTEVDTLLHVSVTDDLVNDDSDGRRGNVVDDTGTTVVVLVRHTLLLSGVGLDVDDISDSVNLEVGREGDHTLVLEVTLEHVARASAETERVRHGDGLRGWGGEGRLRKVAEFESKRIEEGEVSFQILVESEAHTIGFCLLPSSLCLPLHPRCMSLDVVCSAHVA
jgi:hypothetical protein